MSWKQVLLTLALATIMGLSAGFVGGRLSMMFSTHESIEAHGFYVVDDEDNLRASLEDWPDGPRLCLFDSNDKLRIELAVVEEASCFHRKGLILKLYDEDGNTRSCLNVSENGNPSLAFLETSGENLWYAPQE